MGTRKRCALACVLAAQLVLGACGAADTSVDHLADAEGAIAGQQYAAAVEAAEAAASSSGKAREAYRLKGIALYKSARYAEAEEAFLQALALSDGVPTDMDIDIALYRAAAFEKSGDYAAADAIYDSILTLHPGHTEALCAKGICVLRSGLYENSLSAADESFARARESASTPGERCTIDIRIALAMQEAGFGEAAMQLLKTGAAASDLSDYDRGRYAFYSGSVAQAQSYLEQAARGAQGAEKAECALLLGLCAEKQGDREYAFSIYTAAIEEGARVAELYNRRGLSYLADGAYDLAIRDFENGLGLGDAGAGQALMRNRITAYAHAGDFKTAAKLMEEYISRYPDDTEAAREAVFLRTR